MPRNEFNRFYEFELTSTGFHYFENKKEKQIEKRNEWIKFWIPVTISILALFNLFYIELANSCFIIRVIS